MVSTKPFLSFLVDEDLLRALDNFRFEQRFESRAAAIKWLLAWALKQKPEPHSPASTSK
jgi:metal-responsive CopG/Arc/MetJ family transcriptional regulator